MEMCSKKEKLMDRTMRWCWWWWWYNVDERRREKYKIRVFVEIPGLEECVSKAKAGQGCDEDKSINHLSG